MAKTVSRKRFGWGTLLVKFDSSQASSPILYAYGEEPDDWRSTPFQAADAQHSRTKALNIVNRWLRSKSNPKKKNSKASSARRSGRTSNKVRKHKKSMKKAGFSGSDIQYVRGKKKNKKKSTARSKSNPGANLKAKINQMKPRTWYQTTLSGAKVKVKRVGQGLVVRPAGKRRKR